MATSTNLGLYLPTREDYISVQRDLTSNYEIIDDAYGEQKSFESGIAIVINGDNAPDDITAGQYLFIKNHSSLATGAYHAKSNIASGSSITSSNVDPDPDGIANSLNSKIGNKLDASKVTFEASASKINAWTNNDSCILVVETSTKYFRYIMSSSGVVSGAVVNK